MDLDVLTGDIRLVNGDIVVVEGTEAVRQRVLIRIRAQVGEWAFDETLGLDYFREILVKSVDVDLVRSRLLTLVATTPGVEQVQFIDVALDETNRSLKMSYVFLVSTEEAGVVPVDESVVFDVDSGELNLLLSSVGSIL